MEGEARREKGGKGVKPLKDAGKIKPCQRCGMRCQVAAETNERSRPIRLANAGYCLECALTNFLKNDLHIEALMQGTGQKAQEALANPEIQAQLYKVFSKGEVEDARVNWPRLIENLDLDAPRAGREEGR